MLLKSFINIIKFYIFKRILSDDRVRNLLVYVG